MTWLNFLELAISQDANGEPLPEIQGGRENGLGSRHGGRVQAPLSTVLECVQQAAVLRAPRDDRPDVDDSVAFNDVVGVEVIDGERRVATQQFHLVTYFQLA